MYSQKKKKKTRLYILFIRIFFKYEIFWHDTIIRPDTELDEFKLNAKVFCV